MWKLFVATRYLINFCGGLCYVKIISLILNKAENYVGPNRDITSSIFGAVTPIALNHVHS